jgi:hypothetical protein
MNEIGRNKKRIKIISVYLIIFLILILIFYFSFRTKETCFDGIKNQNEEGVDCGDVCKKCEKIEAKNIIVSKAGAIETGIVGQKDFFAEVYNPNDRYGSKLFQYEFVFKNSSDEKVFSKKGSSFILPGEKKYVIEFNVPLENEFSKTEFIISDSEWTEFNEYYEKPQLKITNKKYNEPNSAEIFGEVRALLKNDSSYDFTSVSVRVILKDSSDEILALNSTELNSVKTGEEREIVFIWPKKFSGTVEKIEIQPEVNIFDSNAFMKKYFKSQNF